MIFSVTESQQSIGDRKINRVAKTFTSNYFLVGLLCLFFAVQAGIFVHYFHKFVEPFYPVNNDQLATYYSVYRRHFYATGELKKSALEAPSIAQEHTSPDSDMRGGVVPALSLLSTFIFGTHRLSIAAINFVFLILGELYIIFGMRSLRGLRSSFLTLGLFLAAQTHYHYCGGLNDMRYDYAGMVTMGMVYISTLLHLQKRSHLTFLLTFGALTLATYTRSIVLFYWVGAFLLASAYSFASSKFPTRFSTTRDDALAMMKLTAAAFASLAIYIGIFWKDFAAYYVACKLGGEDLMRLRESGVNSIFERLIYYPNSFLEHFRRPLETFIVCLPITLFFGKTSTSKTGRVNDSISVTTNVITASLITSVFACVTFYAPTPLVIGVLAIPVSVWCAIILDSLLSRNKNKIVSAVLVSSVVLVGVYTFVQELTRPTYPPHPRGKTSTAAEEVLSDLDKVVSAGDGTGKRIYWCLIHDGINQLYFEIKHIEVTGHPLSIPITHKVLWCFPKSNMQTFNHRIDQCDYVVIGKMPPPEGFEYDGSTSLRENYQQIIETLNKNFKLVSAHNYSQPGYATDGIVKIYARCSGVRAPDSVK